MSAIERLFRAGNPSVRARAVAACAFLVCAGQLGAQGPVTDADLARARRDQPTVTEQDIDRARRQHGQAAAGVPELPAGSTGPRLNALPQPLTGPTIDLEALARGYAAQADPTALAQGLHHGPGLIVFISLSVPRPTLDRLLDQAARARASVVLRGFANGSLQATVAQLQALIGQRQIAVQIDPPAFDRFAVTHVPSFVLLRDGTRPASCASGTCAPAEDFLKVDGDVSLDFALAHMQRAAPAFHTDAERFLARLRP